ncbi:MAG TPA: hypothetical protein VEK15_14585 [Vicinamibacteria bacterium]|nr:hypothetical protein [Vicinamibacteria bacterium]
MTMRRRSAYAAGLALILVIAPSGGVTEAGQEKFRETYEAFAVAMGTTNPPVLPPGVSTTLQINVTRWTTDEERNALFATLIEKGQEGLVGALQKQEETGFVRLTGRGAQLTTFPSERLRYARQMDVDGKRRLVLAMDRPISFWEAANQPRWRDYDMTLIVMDVDQEGKGEGQLAMAVRLVVDQEKKTLMIENFGTEPIRLTSIRRRD